MLECLNFSTRNIISYGLPVLIAMSSRRFEFLTDELGFNTDYTSNSRKLAQEFSEAALPSIGVSTPKESVAEKFYDNNRLLAAWQNVFAQFQVVGQDNDICNWILKLRNEDATFGSRIRHTAWNFLLFDWAMNPSSFPSLQLSQNTIQDMRIYALQQRAKEYEWHFRFPKQADTTNVDEWEVFIIEKQGAGTWMQNRIWQQQHMTKWVGILSLLSDHEVEIMDNWGYKIVQKSYNPEHYFHLTDFAKDLKDAGYYR